MEASQLIPNVVRNKTPTSMKDQEKPLSAAWKRAAMHDFERQSGLVSGIFSDDLFEGSLKIHDILKWGIKDVESKVEMRR